MGYTKQTAAENRAIYNAAKAELERIGYDDPPSVFAVSDAIRSQFPGIPRTRIHHQINRVLMQQRRRGAPVGNTNATRKDGQPRPQLNVRVEQVTLDWLQAQADKTTGGNIGRWLDTLPD